MPVLRYINKGFILVFSGYNGAFDKHQLFTVARGLTKIFVKAKLVRPKNHDNADSGKIMFLNRITESVAVSSFLLFNPPAADTRMNKKFIAHHKYGSYQVLFSHESAY